MDLACMDDLLQLLSAVRAEMADAAQEEAAKDE